MLLSNVENETEVLLKLAPLPWNSTGLVDVWPPQRAVQLIFVRIADSPLESWSGHSRVRTLLVQRDENRNVMGVALDKLFHTCGAYCLRGSGFRHLSARGESKRRHHSCA